MICGAVDVSIGFVVENTIIVVIDGAMINDFRKVVNSNRIVNYNVGGFDGNGAIVADVSIVVYSGLT